MIEQFTEQALSVVKQRGWGLKCTIDIERQAYVFVAIHSIEYGYEKPISFERFRACNHDALIDEIFTETCECFDIIDAHMKE